MTRRVSADPDLDVFTSRTACTVDHRNESRHPRIAPTMVDRAPRNVPVPGHAPCCMPQALHCALVPSSPRPRRSRVNWRMQRCWERSISCRRRSPHACALGQSWSELDQFWGELGWRQPDSARIGPDFGPESGPVLGPALADLDATSAGVVHIPSGIDAIPAPLMPNLGRARPIR